MTTISPLCRRGSFLRSCRVAMGAALFAGTIGGAGAVASATSPTPEFRRRDQFAIPPYPEEARGAGVQGTAFVKVVFDDNGNVVSSVILKSTGNDELDNNLPSFINAHWKGRTRPAYTKIVEFVYQFNRRTAYYSSPIPIYSAEAKRVRIHNYLKLLVCFTVHGDVDRIFVLHASGSKILDDETSAFIKAKWRSYQANPEMRKVTFKFTLEDQR